MSWKRVRSIAYMTNEVEDTLKQNKEVWDKGRWSWSLLCRPFPRRNGPMMLRETACAVLEQHRFQSHEGDAHSLETISVPSQLANGFASSYRSHRPNPCLLGVRITPKKMVSAVRNHSTSPWYKLRLSSYVLDTLALRSFLDLEEYARNPYMMSSHLQEI